MQLVNRRTFLGLVLLTLGFAFCCAGTVKRQASNDNAGLRELLDALLQNATSSGTGTGLVSPPTSSCGLVGDLIGSLLAIIISTVNTILQLVGLLPLLRPVINLVQLILGLVVSLLQFLLGSGLANIIGCALPCTVDPVRGFQCTGAGSEGLVGLLNNLLSGIPRLLQSVLGSLLPASRVG